MTNMEHHDSKNPNSMFKIVINLMAACIISGLIIATVYSLTYKTAEQNQIELTRLSMQNLVASADEFIEIEGQTDWYEAVKEGQIIAYVVPSESKGYAGSVKLLVAVKPDLTIMNYVIVESKETPGLGDKAAQEPFIGQFPGKKIENLEVVKDPSDTEHILAISGATITSRAVTDAVKKALVEMQEFLQEGK